MRLVRLLPLSLLSFLWGCQQYYLSVSQQWVDSTYLASTHVSTPDPRQQHPPLGQMLVLDWRVPEEIFAQNPSVVIDVILWDYTKRQIRIPIKHRMDFTSYRLLDEDYRQSGGILTYRAQIITEEGCVFREWRHQLWVELITVEDSPNPPEGGDTESARKDAHP